jgi:murein DD-endopeptidase MepM/ murein hydrolase activator NlpD
MKFRKRFFLQNKIKILSIFIIAIFVFVFLVKKDEKKDIHLTKNKKTDISIKKVPQGKKKLVKLETKIQKGDTIINVLERVGMERQTAYKLVFDIKPVYNLKKIRAGNKFILYKKDNKIKKVVYEIDPDSLLNIVKDKHGSFKGKLITIHYDIKTNIIRGKIQDSLFESILELGEKPELADIFASLYEYDIDFNRDIRKNDTFVVLVEKKYLNNKFIKYRHILAAEFINRGKSIKIIRYTNPEGKTAFFHPDGRAVKKMFLRCPLPFMRVTSRYGMRRHPVLGFSAKHNGVDFGAPKGTKIRASATGYITKTGYNRIMGRYIMIRHPNKYISHYYHLSRIKKGIRSGIKVNQGETIGYVGNTGRSTGPHLHYGLQKNRRYLDPLRLKSPTKNPVKKCYLENFKQYSAKIFLLIYTNEIVNISEKFQKVFIDYAKIKPYLKGL